jgi:hypothetical protein
MGLRVDRQVAGYQRVVHLFIQSLLKDITVQQHEDGYMAVSNQRSSEANGKKHAPEFEITNGSEKRDRQRALEWRKW